MSTTCTIVVTQNTDNSIGVASTDEVGAGVYVPVANSSQAGPQLKRVLLAIRDILQVKLNLAE